ncbi:hypothetical protein [Streptomyces sp. NBC_00576]|uniref:hypothetical protein n=1 Tax=Streptomyces sp. NBC_00576 TaxID=2903665 RepID=UPI002E824A49|nr:hypothetical protein [Streptomyces sp. NBC_00576]WUB73226.1 hypothetical protein OG734_25850 [Streptomyces sp. NBC_00576]
MARAGRLKKPELTGQAHRALNDALHQLHAYAKYPPLTSLEGALAQTGVPYASRATIHNAFSSTRLPRVGLVDALAVELASRVRNTDPEKIDAVSIAFDNLWFLADLEDRQHQAGAEKMADSTESSPSADEGNSGAASLPALTLAPSTTIALPSAEQPDMSVRLRLLDVPDQGLLRKLLKEPELMTRLCLETVRTIVTLW